MSTKNVENITTRTTTQGRGKTLTQGRFSEGFPDHTGVHPTPGNEDNSVISRGGKSIDLFGADVPNDTLQGTYNEYTQVYEFNYGENTIEFNSTPGNERIMLRHRTGSGVNIGPDGSIIVSGNGNRIDKAADYILEVANGQMTFTGNLTLNVTGDLDINVGGEFNVKSSKKTEKIAGPSETEITGDDIKTVDGNQTNLVLGGGAHQYLEGLSTIVKGDSRYVVEGDHTDAISGVLTMTAEQEIILTSPEANIAADNLSVFGDTGTIGGENMQMYTKNLRANKTVYATESVNTKTLRASTSVETHSLRGTVATLTRVNADLNGNALTATTAGTSLHQSYSDGTYVSSSGTGVSPGSYTPGIGSNPGYTVATASLEDAIDDDTSETALPTANLLTDYRTKGTKGVKKVQVDPGNVIKNNIDYSIKTAGVTNKKLTAAESRRKMRDPAHRANAEFTTQAVSEGNLSPEFANSTPPNISAVEDTSSIIVQGQTPLGSPTPVLTSKRIKV